MSETTVVSRDARFLTDNERLAIIAAVQSGFSHSQVAQQFGVHRVTVSKVMRKVKEATQQTLGMSTFEAGYIALDNLSLQAVTRSLQDTQDVHKAAGTAQNHWKGTGRYTAAVGSVTTNIYVDMRDLPADWRARGMLANDDDAELIERMRTAVDVDSRPVDDNA